MQSDTTGVDHQQLCIFSKAVPPELLEIVYLSRRILWRESTSTLSCIEQQASHEYYQLSLPVGECGLPLIASGSPKMPLLSLSFSRCSLVTSPSLLCSPPGCSPCYPVRGVPTGRGVSHPAGNRQEEVRDFSLSRREVLLSFSSPAWAGGEDDRKD